MTTVYDAHSHQYVRAFDPTARVDSLGHVEGRTGTRREEDRTNPKAALGATKPMLGLNPPVALLHMAKAFEFGAHGRDANGVQVRPKGYGEYNWRNTDIAEMVYIHAIQRHVAHYLDGQDVAADSKVKHLGHIMACCAILLDAEECGTLVHDRPPKGKAADLIERLTVKKTGTPITEIKSVAIDQDKLGAIADAVFKTNMEELERKLYALDRDGGRDAQGVVAAHEFGAKRRTRRQADKVQGQKRKGGRSPRKSRQ